MKEKLKSTRGLTLVEMLACVLVLLMIAGFCSTGMGLAVSSYDRSLFQSESQYLENTINTVLGDILRHAEDIEVDGDKNVTSLTNSKHGLLNGNLVMNEDNGTLYTISGSGTNSAPLVQNSVYAGSLYLVDWSLTFDGEIFTARYSIKCRKFDDTDPGKPCVVSFRNITKLDDELSA